MEIALEYVEGSAFERFFHAFGPEMFGINFVPLGGPRDGGADAFEGQIYEGRSTHFYQASVEKDYGGKIRRTLKRLTDFGRGARILTYVSSREIPNSDVEEESLSEELDITVRIRSRKWIAANINRNAATQAAFGSHLRPYTAFLSEIGGARLIDRPPLPASTEVCVFLGQEVERRRSKSDLLTSIVDSLILWALSDTDPQKGKLLSRREILARIEEVLPTARHFVRGTLDHRLETLASKNHPTGREVRWHKKIDKFALPYETRQVAERENIEDESLKLAVLERFISRAIEYCEKQEVHVAPTDLADLALSTVQRVFEKEGLRSAAFFSDGEGDIGGPVADRVDEVLADSQIGGSFAIEAKDSILNILRQAFYQSSPEEREYFGKLSRTFALLFSLSADPHIIEYFKQMSSNFVLYVGADLIIQAFSERYLFAEDRMVTNMLEIVRASGSKLILSEPTLDEVRGHLHATDVEFRILFSEVEPYVRVEHARHSSKPLIRAYFYSRLSPIGNIRPPAGWRSFIGQFCTYEKLQTDEGKRELKQYIVERFGMEFESHDDLGKLTDDAEVAELADRFKSIKNDDVLAINDARQIFAIYGKREILHEDHKPNPYGFRTWWLTHESIVRRFTADIVARRGSQYILRPEFVLNFIALSPTTEQVRESYRSIFPSMLGLTLSNRMKDSVFKDVMKRVKELGQNDEARLKVIMANLANSLKSDRFKIYEVSLSGSLDFARDAGRWLSAVS
ncbi:MAG TPA: hypothetical protein VM755_04690 [Stellaceae bacterium]|nr:hypothetical protein [Stellaceae bacterium]